MPAHRFIPVEELRKLALGSYEHVISAVESLVRTNARRLFGEDTAIEIIGTFPGHAIVMAEDGRVAKVHFDLSEDRKLQLRRHEMVDVPAYDSGNVEEFVKKEILQAVQAWKAGRVTEAEERIARVSPYVSERIPQSDKKIVDSVIGELSVTRAWKQVMERRRGAIEEDVGGTAVEEIHSSVGAPKFVALYEGKAPQRVDEYRDLVRSSMSYLTTRVESLGDLIESSYEATRSVVGSESLKSNEALATFVLFTEDLISDLRRLYDVLKESKKLAKINHVARLHDAVTSRLADYEVAGRFVAVTSQRLREAC